MFVDNDYKKWIWYRKNVDKRYYYSSKRTFLTLEKNELLNAKFIAKSKEKLTSDSLLIFNECVLVQDGNAISLR
jgi:hypothetical protein